MWQPLISLALLLALRTDAVIHEKLPDPRLYMVQFADGAKVRASAFSAGC
jgi:hypothetical protein